ncbi:hypothetical protein BJI67_16285 (plasmid) [Acidihalobacter aeolianus]|uniref:RNA polymerase sigma-70 region 2 domain-containing protein n=1 Tax=Acidihalobacter aeolianus TaxID=2792603 RepID=A0A1D8KCW1_9GAMM|nr:hypothetical protein BJI67_16285 [Acidihalobacter aeolianus]
MRARACRLTQRYGISEADSEDIAQQVLIALPAKIAQTYDPSRPLEPFINSWLSKTGAALWRKKSRERAFSELENSEGDGQLLLDRLSEAQFDTAADIDAVDSIDVGNALSEYMRLRQTHEAPKPIVTLSQSQPAPTKPSESERQTDQRDSLGQRDHDELKAILAELRITRNDFAALLGIGKPRLASYLYKATKTVPASVMERAREAKRIHKPTADNLDARYHDRISETLNHWIERYRLPEDNKQLGKILGVDPVTIKRWRRDQIQPSLRKTQEYEQRAVLWARMDGAGSSPTT